MQFFFVLDVKSCNKCLIFLEGRSQVTIKYSFTYLRNFLALPFVERFLVSNLLYSLKYMSRGLYFKWAGRGRSIGRRCVLKNSDIFGELPSSKQISLP